MVELVARPSGVVRREMMFDVKMALSTSTIHNTGPRRAEGDWFLNLLLLLGAGRLFCPTRR